ncbi:MAG: hypothetical protein MZW92_55510 [Comamonadaceae bacterium]|nr:hypothetical protein [Comamonadaceae bacterium]
MPAALRRAAGGHRCRSRRAADAADGRRGRRRGRRARATLAAAPARVADDRDAAPRAGRRRAGRLGRLRRADGAGAIRSDEPRNPTMKLWSDSWTNGDRIPPRYAAGRLDGAGGVELRRQPESAPGLERPARAARSRWC